MGSTSSVTGCPPQTNSTRPIIHPSFIPSLVYTNAERTAITITNPILLSFGLLSNSSFLFMILRISRMKTTVNLYLATLAVSDTLFLTTAILDKIFRFLVSPISNDQHMLGVPGCMLIHGVINLFYSTSLCLITLISIERYYAICQPVKHRAIASKSRTKQYIALAWFLGAILAGLLLPLHSKLLTFCVYWPPGYTDLPEMFGYCNPVGDRLRQWSAFWKIAPFVFSLLINMCLYILIIRSLGGKIVPNTDVPSTSSSDVQQARRIKTRNQIAVMLIVNGLVFFICLAPHQIFTIVLEFSLITGNKLDDNVMRRFFKVAQSLTYINAVINPVVYNVFNSQYSQAFREAFSSCSFAFKTDGRSSVVTLSTHETGVDG